MDRRDLSMAIVQQLKDINTDAGQFVAGLLNDDISREDQITFTLRLVRVAGQIKQRASSTAGMVVGVGAGRTAHERRSRALRAGLAGRDADGVPEPSPRWTELTDLALIRVRLASGNRRRCRGSRPPRPAADVGRCRDVAVLALALLPNQRRTGGVVRACAAHVRADRERPPETSAAEGCGHHPEAGAAG